MAKTGTYFSKLYDILAQGISILDVTTDIIVCIEFYQNDRTFFFAISLVILILALIAYDIAFMVKFSSEYHICSQICFFLSLLPISPFIPFVFYYVDNNDSNLPKLMKQYWCFEMSFHNGPSTTKGASKFKQFFESKIDKHLGFILESLVEALPQAVLQMASIVIYNEANIISIISILISLLSVSSKSFVFSMGTATNMKQLFFNWLCAVADFFGVFFVVSWVTYKPQPQYLLDAFMHIRKMWLYQLYIFELPMIGFVSIFLHIVFVSLIVFETNGSACKKALYGWLGFFGITFAWFCGLIASILVVQIACWSWIAIAFLYLGIQRYPQYHKQSLQFWYTLVDWINSAGKHRIGSKYKGCTSYTKKQDRMMRLASVNYITAKDQFAHVVNDNTFITYLDQQREKSQYMNVTMKGLRINTANLHRSQFDRKFWEWYATVWRDEAKGPIERQCRAVCYDRRCPGDCHQCHDCCLDVFFATAVGSLTFFFGPIYLASRLLKLFFPAYIVLYLYFGYDVFIWNTMDIDIFQIVMITIHIVLYSILSILFYFNAKEQYLMAHILPSVEWMPEIKSDEQTMELKIQAITNHYYGIIVVPIRRAIIIDRFGPDIGSIIVAFLPTDDQFEIANNVVRVTTVV